MAHDPRVKAEAIALLLAGGGLGAVAKATGLERATIQNWRRELQSSGQLKRQPKAGAEGDPPAAPEPVNPEPVPGRIINTPDAAIQVQNVLNTPEGINTPPPNLNTQKKTRAELVDELANEKLLTLIAQEAHFRDKSWLSRQSAHDMAILNGTSADKLIRILEAIERGNRPPPPSLPLNNGS